MENRFKELSSNLNGAKEESHLDCIGYELFKLLLWQVEKNITNIDKTLYCGK